MNRLLAPAVLLLALPPLSALAARCPNILIVFDVSGSMGSNVALADGGFDTRYEVGRDAVKALLNGNSANFRYGLELFGTQANSGCGVSSCYYSTSTTCGTPPTPCACESVLCDYNTNASISKVLDNREDDGLTPTAIAINTARTRTDMTDTTRNRYIILLTDGDPNCATGSGTAISETVTALNNARTAGIKTYVLGFAGGSASNLNQMAVAGGTPRQADCTQSTSRCYYDAADPAQLNAALSAIISAVGGELGGSGACDDSCYGGGCATGQLCKNATCVTDPCASVSCTSGVCVDGQCKAPCNPACFNNQYCDNGECKPDVACPGDGGCSGRNQTCVNGQCVEDWCAHPTHAINCGSDICVKNSCQNFIGGAGGGSGGRGAGDGGSGGTGGGSGGVSSSGTGCCSGAPGATSLFGLLLGLSVLAGLRRRVAKR